MEKKKKMLKYKICSILTVNTFIKLFSIELWKKDNKIQFHNLTRSQENTLHHKQKYSPEPQNKCRILKRNSD